MTRSPGLGRRLVEVTGSSTAVGRAWAGFTVASLTITVLGALLQPADRSSALGLGVVQLLASLGAFWILRPRSFRRSVWRSMFAAWWLFPAAVILLLAAPSLADFADPRRAMQAWLSSTTLAMLVCSSAMLVLIVSSIFFAVPAPVRQGAADSARPAGLGMIVGVLRLGAVSALAVLTIGAGAIAFPIKLMGDLGQSHVESNVPAASDFEAIMERDVLAFAVTRDSAVTDVQVSLLRQGPTQSGIAYPKYYAWVVARRAGSTRWEGAARMAAIDRERFEVYDFLSAEEIGAAPARVAEVFPAALTDRIQKSAVAISRR